MFQVVEDFFRSEKGVFGYAIPLMIATVFVFLGRITEQQWMDFSIILVGIYTGGKTLQGSAAVIANGKQLKAKATAAKAEAGLLRSAITRTDTAADTTLETKFMKKDGE